ncbi:MAG: S41 family peptidase [Muribaculaceae bacterium]|nr:S41 family peptidase [Muribaculaceae bacterium]
MKKTLKFIAWGCVALSMAAPVALADTDRAVNDDAAVARSLDIFNTLYKELNTFYVDTIDAQKTIENAINAMLDDIDPYTEYIPAKETDEFMTLSTGEYGGIGSYIMERTIDGKKSVYISGPYEGSPAARAGMRAGDRIIMIDNDSTTGWSSDQVSKRLKGQANTHLTVTVVRPYDEDSVKTFNLTRETISVNPVPYYGVTRDNIGYICLTTFNEKSAQQVRDAVIELKKNPKVKNIVLDLRGNGGGIVEGAIQIVGCFVPKGTQVLQMRGREKSSERTYKTTVDPVDTEIPLAVLIDGGSASASEITAGALQDLDRAVIIGARSFGKGLVQSTRTLPYDGMLKVTIAKYYIPSGRLIQEVDYGNRNDDGTFKKTTTDSTARVFHTAHGREVLEGGGIMPDIKVEPRELKRIVYNIMRDRWDFDFATKYVAEHRQDIANPADFEVTDEIFNEFKAFINPEKFEYDKVCEQQLATLRKTAKAEGYMNDSTEAQFDRLEALLKHDLDHDLDLHRSDIAYLLGQEIMDRTYYQRGQVQNSIKQDEYIDKAKEMFDKPGEFARLLNIKTKTSKKATSSKKKKK